MTTNHLQFTGRRPRVRTRAAAAYLDCSPSKLNKDRITGNGPPFYEMGAVVLYNLDELDSWLLQRRRTSTGEYTR